MTELLVPLVKFSLNLISSVGYPGIVVVMALENIFPPIPSEVVMPFSGFLITQGRFTTVYAIAAGVLGSVVGALILYGFGACFRGERLRSFLEKYGKYAFVSTEDLDTAEHYFNRYGDWAVLIARVIPIIRSIISVPAGFVKMGIAKFLSLTILGTAIWTTLLTYSGIILGENWGEIGPILQKYENVVLGIIIAAVIFYIYRKLRSKSAATD